MNILQRPTFLPRLRNEPHVEFNREFRDSALERGLGSIGITDIMTNRYDPAYNLVVARLDALHGSDLTPEIRDQDHVRDDSYRGLYWTVHGLTFHPDAVKRAAALKVKSYLDHYGDISARPYDDQSAALDDVARELRAPGHLELVTLLGLLPWLQVIEEENTRFVRLMEARNKEVGHRPSTDMKLARAALDLVLNDVIDRVEAQITLYGLTSTSSDYAPFANDWNALVDRYRRTLAVERGRRAAARQEESEES
jgi:hypothetical protein